MGKFSWKIWTKKIVKNLVVVIIAGLAATYGDSTLYLAIAPVLLGLENYVKHK